MEDLDRRYMFRLFSMTLLTKFLAGLQGKALMFYFVGLERENSSGVMVRNILTSIMKRIKSSKAHLLYWERVNLSPYEIILCHDTRQSMYCQLLCGLVRRDQVVRIGSLFASTLLQTIKFLEHHWHELCSNIRTGLISDWIKDPGCRTSVSKVLSRPNLELADVIERECSGKSWEAIIGKLWSRAMCIQTVVTGSMAQYIPMLEFYGGGLPLVSSRYGCSECSFGINTNPSCKPVDVSYTIIPNMAYFEFLEVDRNHEELGDHTSGTKKDQLVDLVDVKIGHYYEPVVTTFTGLYRYRIGDILRVTGFYNNAPKFHFVRREKIVLSIDADKTNEEDLVKAVMHARLALEPHSLLLTDFTSHGDVSSIPGHYVLYWELRSKFKDKMPELDPSIFEECCFLVEESLDMMYRKCRNFESIGPLEIKLVRHGVFNELMDFLLSRGSSLSQYKTPICITDKQALNILDSGAVLMFLSQRTPSLELRDLHSLK